MEKISKGGIPEVLLHEVRVTHDNDVSWTRTQGDIKGLRASMMRDSDVKYEYCRKQQSFDDVGEGRDDYLELFRNEEEIRGFQELPDFSVKRCDNAGQV